MHTNVIPVRRPGTAASPGLFPGKHENPSRDAPGRGFQDIPQAAITGPAGSGITSWRGPRGSAARRRVAVHDLDALRQRFQVRQIAWRHGRTAQRFLDGLGELGRQGGFQHQHGHARLDELARDLDAVGGVRIDQHAGLVVHRTDGGQAVGVSAGARYEAVARFELGLERRQVEGAVARQAGPAPARGPGRGPPDRTRSARSWTRARCPWTAGRGVGLLGRTRTVDAGAEELFQHVVLVRGQHQPAHRQPHAAGNVARQDVAEVTRGHRERDRSPALDVARSQPWK